MQLKTNHKRQVGFTLIELLMVVTLIGILSGLSVVVLNPRSQKDTAQDANLRANMLKTCLAIKAYGEAEGGNFPKYPEEGDVNNPLDSTAGTHDIAAEYIQSWPEGFIYNVAPNYAVFDVYVPLNSSSNYLKCSSSFNEIRECMSTDIDNLTYCLLP
jgi:prepilin-type N-terminal cleavage/methylation domain-containing protein